MATPPVFPLNTAANLAYPVIRRPIWAVSVAKAASGRTTRLAYWTYPMWEWDLTWEVLLDSDTPSDLQTMIGAFIQQVGPVNGFSFLDQDENQVTAQPLGTGDGVTTTFNLAKTYGAGGFSGTEPIGVLGTVTGFYLNGALQTPISNYTTGGIPGAQTITFVTAPGVGVAITGSYQFYYYAGFKDISIELEKFMNQFWLLNKLTIQSLRD